MQIIFKYSCCHTVKSLILISWKTWEFYSIKLQINKSSSTLKMINTLEIFGRSLKVFPLSSVHLFFRVFDENQYIGVMLQLHNRSNIHIYCLLSNILNYNNRLWLGSNHIYCLWPNILWWYNTTIVLVSTSIFSPLLFSNKIINFTRGVLHLTFLVYLKIMQYYFKLKVLVSTIYELEQNLVQLQLQITTKQTLLVRENGVWCYRKYEIY